VARATFFAVLFVAIFNYPAFPSNELDASWRMTLTTGLVEGWQFGKDLVFTYGPLGFLMGNTYSGVAFWPFLVWQVAQAAVFAAIIYRQGLRLTGYPRAFYWGAMALLCIGYIDALMMVAMLTAAAELVRTAGRPGGWWRQALLVMFALLAAVKFTNLLVAGFVIAVVAALNLWEKRPGAALRLVLGFGLPFVAVWLLCLQNPLHFLAYIRNSLEISSGYEQTMGIPTPPEPFWKGLVVFAALAVYAAVHWLGNANRARGLAGALIVGAFVYLNWKHGFVRSDGHMIGFFICAFVPITAFPSLFDEPERFVRPLRWLLVPAGILAAIGMSDALPGTVTGALGLIQTRLYSNIYNTVHFDTYRQQYRDRLRAARSDWDMPKTRAVIGEHSVDVLGYLQGVALLNRLNYQPRPVMQSYSAYTPRLAQLNADYYASERAPDFVLFRLETIDDRYMAVDDSRALYLFLHRYEYVHSERGYQLWRRLEKKFDPAAIAPRPLYNRELAIGQPLDLRLHGKDPLWIEIDVSRSLLGRLRDFIYKPPFVRLSLKDTKGNTTTYRMPTPLGRVGFIANPMIEELVGFMNFTGGTPERYLAELTVEIDADDRRYFSDVAKVSVSSIKASTHGMDYFLEAEKNRFHMFKTVPISYEAQNPPSEGKVDGQPVIVMHARSEMVFNLKEGVTHASGYFGFLPGAYTNGGNTDGAEFSVSWSNGGERIELFKRLLDPVHVAADRSLQSFEVTLPQRPGGRLFLRVAPGPLNNHSWDWTAWGGVEIK